MNFSVGKIIILEFESSLVPISRSLLSGEVVGFLKKRHVGIICFDFEVMD